MIGQHIAQYEILAELGRGGMGVVYKARDTRLERVVALKVLAPHLSGDPKAQARFEQEAKAASALAHDHICAVLEIGGTDDGRLWMALPYYEGGTLREALSRGNQFSEAEVTRIGQRIALALEAAHRKGIIHRDIKPGNLIVPPDGTLKVLDFGLAKFSDSIEITESGTTVGSAAYMSPEQARAEDVTTQTDVWSLGVVLYELLQGRRPFDGRYPTAVAYAVLHEEPPPLTGTDETLADLVILCLEKDPQRRPDMAEVAAALGGFSDSGATVSRLDARPKPSRRASVLIAASIIVLGIASFVWYGSAASSEKVDASTAPRVMVLPFDDVSRAGDQRYLADGLSQGVASSLTRRGALVPGRHVAKLFKSDREKAERTLGGTIELDYIVDGTVREEENQARVSVQLVSLATGFTEWDTLIARSSPDLALLESDILMGLSVRLNLGGAEVPTFVPSGEAMTEYLLGVSEQNKQDAESLLRSLDHLKRATDLQPAYAEAWSAMTRSLGILSEQQGGLDPDRVADMRAYADSATKIAPGSYTAALAQQNLASVELNLGRALRLSLEALGLRPGESRSYFEPGVVLGYGGEIALALPFFERAAQLDPAHEQVLTNLIWGNAMLGDLSESAYYRERLQRFSPDYFYFELIQPKLSVLLPDLVPEADLRVFDTLPPDGSVQWKADYFGQSGRWEDLSTLYDSAASMELGPSTWMVLSAWKGDLDAAFEFANQAIDAADAGLPFAHWIQTPASFHDDPRFEALQARLGWPPKDLDFSELRLPE